MRAMSNSIVFSGAEMRRELVRMSEKMWMSSSRPDSKARGPSLSPVLRKRIGDVRVVTVLPPETVVAAPGRVGTPGTPGAVGTPGTPGTPGAVGAPGAPVVGVRAAAVGVTTPAEIDWTSRL